MNAVGLDATDVWEPFGERLRYWRRRARLTQVQLGARLGYHHSQISKLESGFRGPQDGIAARADEVLGTGGELAAIWESIAQNHPTTVTTEVPPTSRQGYLLMPAEPADYTSSTLNAVNWPSRLPAHGLPCPLHQFQGCKVPSPAEALGAYMNARLHEQSHTPPSGHDPDLLHALTALLAAYCAASIEGYTNDVAIQVERILHTIVRWTSAMRGSVPRAVVRLCSHYAELAGWLRVLRGQRAMGMVWFTNGMRWATASDDHTAKVLLLANMSIVARMEGDGQSALACAQTIAANAGERRWVCAVSALYEARALAFAHQQEKSQYRLDQARILLRRLDERDRLEAPWLTGREGQARIDACLSGSLRDLAAATRNRQLGQRAVVASRSALSNLPAWMHPTRLMLTLRLADSYACAGRPDDALATIHPILPEVAKASRITIRQELRGLHRRLMANWPALPEVRAIDEYLRHS